MRRGLRTFLASLAPLNDKIAAIRGKYAGTPVTASEPVFGPMADALELKMANERFQLAIMNDTEPSARDVAAFERDFKTHKVRVLFYNKQASNKVVAAPRRSGARRQHSGCRHDRDRARRSIVPGLDADAARRDAARAGRAFVMNVIELDRATLAIGGRDILVDTSFAIRRGEFIGVLGPNGAGKTTLMRAILGLLPPRAGSLRVFGRAPQRGDPQIGYLPQVRTVVPDLRVRGFDFIASSVHGERWGVPSLTRADRPMIEKTLAAVGAADLAARPLSDMSGGERQRLLLAQALLGEPQLLLLDEPLISLDYRYQEAVIDLVRRFARERNITVLFSAHELNQLIGTLDRVLYLGNGHAALGTVAEVATAPVLSKLYGTDIQVVQR